MLHKLAAVLAIAAMTGLAAGCNTVEGVGKDIKATGSAVEKAADNAKKK
jgi:predicted small secreted protein